MGCFSFLKVMMILFNLAIFVSTSRVSGCFSSSPGLDFNASKCPETVVLIIFF